MRRPLLLLALALLPAAALAQPAPDTDVFLLPLDTRGPAVTVGAPVNVTARPGYDNQPAFHGCCTVYYTAQHDGQTDIYRYTLGAPAPRRVTRTATSEYSPTPLPGGDALSVVRVEADGTQRLWEFNLGGTNPVLVLPEVRPVGYHAWRGDGTLALFVLGEPPTLQLAQASTGTAEPVARGIGRALHLVPGTDRFSFIDKSDPDAWWVATVDPATAAVERLVKTRPGREDVCWAPDGTLLQGDGSTLWAWRAGAAEWTEVADLAPAGLTNLTRCAVAPRGGRLALVAEPGR